MPGLNFISNQVTAMTQRKVNVSGERWDKPKSRNVGLFIDLSLYSEALKITAERASITALHLRQELSQRTRGLLFVEEQSERVARDLARELNEFGWLQRSNGSGRSVENTLYTLTPDGNEILRLNDRQVRRHLAVKMHERYTIPGWFIARLWKINPTGQGEVILPSPPSDWRPKARPWDEKEWTDDLTVQVKKASRMAEIVCPGSFPISDDIWVQAVSEAWRHLGTWKQKRKADASGEKIRTFSPRRRLALAMRRAAIEILFNVVPFGRQEVDIWSNKQPLFPRAFTVWCPRLADLEFVFYTDKHPNIVGRLIFPTSVFRQDAPSPPFEKVSDIQSPEKDFLWLYQPDWKGQRDIFLQTLIQTHRLISQRMGTLYVSLLDVRDEVCRQLRLSTTIFDKFLAHAFRESLHSEAAQSISIESDVREDQRSGSGLLRRPVWIDGVPYSLVAIGKTNL
jgi:hypothetical protein